MISNRDNVRNLTINRPGLFTPTVVRGFREGANHQTVNFTKQTNDLVDTSVGNTGSFKYTIEGMGLKSTQQLNIDWENFENHTFYNSAQVKTNIAFEKIFNEFPFDGNNKELEDYFASLTGYEKWIYDSFPKNKGYFFFSGSKPAEFGGGTYITVKDIAGAAYPSISKTRSGNTVINPEDSSMTLEMWLYLPTTINSSSAIIDKHVDTGTTGSRQGFYVSLEATGSATTGSVTFTAMSGAIKDSVSVTLAKGSWNHVAWVWDRTPSVQKIFSYVDNVLHSSSSQGIEFGTIAAETADMLIGSGSAVTGLFDPLTTFSGAIDELRIWHSVRSVQDMTLYKQKAIFASDDLAAYYKFNEASGSNSTLVIDHSSNAVHGKINANGYTIGVREVPTGSIAGSSPMTWEKIADSPVLFPTQNDVLELRTELLLSASRYDLDNPNLITKLIPVHYFLEGQAQDALSTQEGDITTILQSGQDPRTVNLGATQVLLILLYTWAKFFDELKLYVQAFSTLNTVDYDIIDTAPDAFLLNFAKNQGIELPPLFNGSSIEQFIDAENIQSDISTNDLTLQNIKNEIWRRILINVKDIIRSKGTIYSIKAFIRSVGIDPDNNFRIREYGGPTKRSLDFAKDNRNEISTMLDFVSGGLLVSPFLSASRTEPGYPGRSSTDSDSLLTSGSFTFEATYKFPKNSINHTTQSLVRFTNTGSFFPTSGGLIANLVAVSGSSVETSTVNLYVNPINEISGSPLVLTVSGVNIFDGDKWYVSFSRQRNDDNQNSAVSSSYHLRVSKQNYGEILNSYVTQSYFNEFSSTHFPGVWERREGSNPSGSLIVIGSSSVDTTVAAYLNGVGLPSIYRTTFFEGKIGQIRFWTKFLTDKEWPEHVRNYRSVGVTDPTKNFNFTHTPSGSWEKLRTDWSTDQPITESNSSGQIFLTDFSQNNLTFTGSNFPLTSSVIQPERFYFSYISPKFDQAATTEKVRVRSYQDYSLVQETPWAEVAPVYDLVRSESPTDNNRFTIDYSVTDALDQDIMTMFANLDSMNNIIGNPELLFSQDYPNLEVLRDIYFNKLTDKMNLPVFLNFYKWFDTNIGTFINQLIPKKTRFLGTNFVIENHVLERPKVDYKSEDIYLGDNTRQSLKDTILLQIITGTVQKY
jgi:hypothetical protein